MELCIKKIIIYFWNKDAVPADRLLPSAPFNGTIPIAKPKPYKQEKKQSSCICRKRSNL
ncbi:hypothetical protein DPMN_065892 [Dreissena polymorpha]|uniref:Uncharacterized protein n=1 Tax=Dreissena polymorpha TaxID=45954 RepID=A0A9D4BRM1_DREPO|nr:hypothetical protein DPMN_065892 [Dreissena polymorpha]